MRWTERAIMLTGAGDRRQASSSASQRSGSSRRDHGRRKKSVRAPAMRKRRRWLLPVAVPASVALGYLLRQQFAPCVLRPTARSTPKHATQRCNDVRPPSDNISCIQQYEWHKCGAPFLQNYCDRACGRCASAERREFFRRTVLVSARQHAPCASAAGDFWVGRAQQNKAEYARAHGMQLVLASALFDGEYEGCLLYTSPSPRDS